MHFNTFNDWHFLNVDRSVKQIPEEACGGDCVLTGIAKHSHDLQTSTNDQDRAEALIFLGHSLGDVHQPLHVSYANDEGGNQIKPVTGGFYPLPKFNGKESDLNLHAVWDGSIIRKAIAGPGWSAFAGDLHGKITPAQKTAWLASSEPLAWAQESYDITTLPNVQYCKKKTAGCQPFGTGRVLKKDYQKKFEKDVDLRLEQGGTRLAALIHAALHP
jgi:hypothetical protein